PRRLRAQPLCLALRILGVRAKLRLARRQSRELDDVENREPEHDQGESTERGLDDAHVVEGPRGEIRAEHHQAFTVSRRVRSAIPPSGPRTSISSGEAVIRSVSAAARVGSAASPSTPSRSWRLYRAASIAPGLPPLPDSSTRANPRPAR